MGNIESNIENSCIERSKKKLQPHQIKVIEYFLQDKTDGLLVVHPTGSGKTLTSVAMSQCFLDYYPERKVIFVSPTNLIENFKNELATYNYKNLKSYKFYSYQKFLQEDEEFRDDLCKGNFLIVDEVHNLRVLNNKSPKKGKRTKSVMRCSRFASKRLLLTATPYVNNLTDFIPIINFIYGKTMLWKKSDASSIKKLSPYLRNKIDYIELSNQNNLYFPSYKEHYIKIKMEKDYETDYCRIIKGNEIKGDIFQNPESFYNGHRRAVNKIGKGDIYFSQKTKKAVNLIKDKKTLIFSNWLDFGLKAMKRILDEKKIKSEQFSGEMSLNEKKKIVENFNENKFQVLIISKSGMEGLDLKEIRNVIIMDPVWNYSGIKQILGRAVRYKSHIDLPKEERHVDIYYLILETTREDCKSGDTIVYDIVKRKRKELEMINSVLKRLSIK